MQPQSQNLTIGNETVQVTRPPTMPIVPIYAVIVVALTAVMCLTLGKKLARDSKVIARFICCLIVPAFVFAVGLAIVIFSPSGPSPNDGPAMAAFGIWLLAGFSLPISIITSFAAFAIMKSPAP